MTIAEPFIKELRKATVHYIIYFMTHDLQTIVYLQLIKNSCNQPRKCEEKPRLLDLQKLRLSEKLKWQQRTNGNWCFGKVDSYSIALGCKHQAPLRNVKNKKKGGRLWKKYEEQPMEAGRKM